MKSVAINIFIPDDEIDNAKELLFLIKCNPNVLEYSHDFEQGGHIVTVNATSAEAIRSILKKLKTKSPKAKKLVHL